MRISDWSSDVCSSDLIGGRQIDRGGVAGAAQRGVYGGGTGIDEQVEKPLAFGLGSEAQAQRPMIEKQAGVEVVEQIDPQQRPALAHDQQRVALILPAIGAAALAAHPGDRKSTRLNSSH